MAAQPVHWLSYVAIGFALVLVAEGLIYALFPQGMKTMLVRMLEVPASTLRSGGLVAIIAGLGLLWLVGPF